MNFRDWYYKIRGIPRPSDKLKSLYIFYDDDYIKKPNGKVLSIPAYTARQALMFFRDAYPQYKYKDLLVVNYTKVLTERKPAPPILPTPKPEQLRLNI